MFFEALKDQLQEVSSNPKLPAGVQQMAVNYASALDVAKQYVDYHSYPQGLMEKYLEVAMQNASNFLIVHSTILA